MANVHPLAWPRWVTTEPMRCSFVARRRRQAEEVGQLVDDDDHGDAGQEAGHDGRREEVGDPAEPQEADQHHDDAHHHGQDRDQVDVVRGAG